MAPERESSVFRSEIAPASPASPLDRFLPATGKPLPLCSDAVFLRRAHLDCLGLLPTAAETLAFLDDRDPAKRRKLAESLPQRPECADYWSMKWAELLRVKSEFPINLWPNAAQAYHRYIHAALRDRLPYDQFVRELLTSTGSNFRAPAVNFYRALATRSPRGWAQAVALTFLAERAEKWTPGKWDSFAACFSQLSTKSTQEWKEEILYHDFTKPTPKSARLPDGTPLDLPPGTDPRLAVADWLTRGPGAVHLARAVVNRIWAWLLGRGIVHPPDDFSPANPPEAPSLLDFLARQLIASRWDLRSTYKLILSSRAFQSAPGHDSFASYLPRPLEAEVLVDAVCRLTDTAEKYTSMIPEPFTVVPEGTRAVLLPDGSITSPALELFGRPPRDTGLADERPARPTVDQRLYLLNSSHVHNKLERGPGLSRLLADKRGPDSVQTLFLAILSRRPTQTELDAVTAHLRVSESTKAATVDLAWALINTAEFLYRH
jgi:hypothetical protein